MPWVLEEDIEIKLRLICTRDFCCISHPLTLNQNAIKTNSSASTSLAERTSSIRVLKMDQKNPPTSMKFDRLVSFTIVSRTFHIFWFWFGIEIQLLYLEIFAHHFKICVLLNMSLGGGVRIIVLTCPSRRKWCLSLKPFAKLKLYVADSSPITAGMKTLSLSIY